MIALPSVIIQLQRLHVERFNPVKTLKNVSHVSFFSIFFPRNPSFGLFQVCTKSILFAYLVAFICTTNKRVAGL